MQVRARAPAGVSPSGQGATLEEGGGSPGPHLRPESHWSSRQRAVPSGGLCPNREAEAGPAADARRSGPAGSSPVLPALAQGPPGSRRHPQGLSRAGTGSTRFTSGGPGPGAATEVLVWCRRRNPPRGPGGFQQRGQRGAGRRSTRRPGAEARTQKQTHTAACEATGVPLPGV